MVCLFINFFLIFINSRFFYFILFLFCYLFFFFFNSNYFFSHLRLLKGNKYLKYSLEILLILKVDWNALFNLFHSLYC